MTPNEAKKLAAAELADGGITYSKLTAKTWDFSDLARGSTVKVTVHGASGPIAAFFDQRAKGKGYLLGIA